MPGGRSAVAATAAAAALRCLASQHPSKAMVNLSASLARVQTVDGDGFGQGQAGSGVEGVDRVFAARYVGNSLSLAQMSGGYHDAAMFTIRNVVDEVKNGVPSDSYLDVGGALNDHCMLRMHSSMFDAEGTAGSTLKDNEVALKRALFMAERAYRPDSDLINTTLSNLGELCFWNGEVERGVAYHQRAVKQRSVDKLFETMETDENSDEAKDMLLLQVLRWCVGDSAAGRSFVLASKENAEVELGHQLIGKAASMLESLVQKESCMCLVTYSSVLRDQALANIFGHSVGYDADPVECAKRALLYAIMSSSNCIQDFSSLDFTLDNILDVLQNPKANQALHSHSVLTSCWVLALCLPPTESQRFLSSSGACSEDCDGRLSEILRKLHTTSMRLSDRKGSLAYNLSLELDGSDSKVSRGAKAVGNLLRQSHADLLQGVFSLGCLGVGTRDWDPSALQWKGIDGQNKK